MRLVWGPPGAGKTRVLANAIQDLIRDGKRVLLLSTANVAVDNALQSVLVAMRPARGTAIRVGPAQLAEIANNPDVNLRTLAAAASVEIDRRLADLERRLTVLDDLDVTIGGLRSEIGDFTPEQFQLLRDKVSRGEKYEQLLILLERDGARRAAIAEKARLAQLEYTAAETASKRVFANRIALQRAESLTADLTSLDLLQKDKESEHAAAALAVQSATGWFKVRKLKSARDKAFDALSAFTRTAEPQRERLITLRQAQLDSAAPVTRDKIDELDHKLTVARDAAVQAAQDRDDYETKFSILQREADAKRGSGLPNDADRELLTAWESADLPTKQQTLHGLIAQRPELERVHATLEREHRTALDRSQQLRTDAEKQLIDDAHLVATTLARSRIHHALMKSTFDVVLIDEAGAASLAEVLLGLCRATRTGVLFGDFLQLPPVQDKNLANCRDPNVRRWVLPDPFTHVGIRTPAEAQRHPSCVTLMYQFRFGASLRKMANDVIYEVLRDADELPDVPANPETDIVLIDTGSLHELAFIHTPGGKRGWWPAGLILSRAIAEHHLPDDHQIGIVTPYTSQKEATLAALRDRNIVTGIAVGTVHAFQGREFPIVVFDLVEDGESWVSQGNRRGNSFQTNGLRLFGVGITRARRRLYLIADQAAVRAATGPALSAVARALKGGRAHVWSGAAMLGLDESTPSYDDDAFTQVSELLRQLVSVTDITDERDFYPELGARLAQARKKVWMWSPWVGKRADKITPVLAELIDRGVDVRLFLRPDEDQLMAQAWAQTRVTSLSEAGVVTIRSDHEHRKIIIVDDEFVLFGSLNPMSNNGGTRECMLTMKGTEFAKRLKAELRADQLGEPRMCSECGTQYQLRRPKASRRGEPPPPPEEIGNWSWYCTKCRTYKKMPTPSEDRR